MTAAQRTRHHVMDPVGVLLATSRIVATGCVAAHLAALLLLPSAGLALMCLVSWACARHAWRPRPDIAVGYLCAVMAAGGAMMVLVHLGFHQVGDAHERHHPGTAANPLPGALGDAGVSLAAGQVLLAGAGAVLLVVRRRTPATRMTGSE